MFTKTERQMFCVNHNISITDREWYCLSLYLQLQLKAAGINSPRINTKFIQLEEPTP